MNRVGQGRGWAALLLMMLGYAALFAVYYPPLSGIEDEVGYVNQALVWSRGVLTSDEAGWPGLADFALVRGRHVGTRNPGRSLLAVPFVWLAGGCAVFASGLALHLATTAIGALLLARLGRSPLWAVLLLCHPTLAIYSRTMMADGAAGAGLLLSTLAVTGSTASAALGAGLAVGGAALMRYHAALALPMVAAAFRFPPGRSHPRRDAALCTVGGGLVGGLIIAFNLAIHASPMEGPATRAGYFATECLVPHLAFYAVALLTVWPGMLLAPLLDRSSLRWLVRGICGIYLIMFALYYFHDRTPRWLETVVVGQRLLQVALPVWIVSYAGVVDDWVAGPLRRRLGGRGWEILMVLACAGLLASCGFIFARHQHHLNALFEVRNELVSHVPEGALIVYRGDLYKLLSIPVEVPSFRLRELEFHGKPAEDPRVLLGDLEREEQPWTFAVLHRHPGEPLSEYACGLIRRFALERVPVRSPLLSIYARREGQGVAPTLPAMARP